LDSFHSLRGLWISGGAFLVSGGIPGAAGRKGVWSGAGQHSKLNLMNSIFLDEALKVVPNQQLLVNIVSKRVRQLTDGFRPLVEVGPRMGFADIALKELAEGRLKVTNSGEVTEPQEVVAS
jgi:DNA-directed RNA polymerase subunit omega